MIESNTCIAPQTTTPPLEPAECTECTLLNHSSMIRHLKMVGYWPHRHQASLRDSVSTVFVQLTSVQVLQWRPRYDSSTSFTSTLLSCSNLSLDS